MAGIAPGVTVALYQLADEIEIGGDGCDPDWRMGFLHRQGHQADVAKPVKFSLIRNPLLGPKPGDDVNAFFEARSALFHADAEDVELLWDEGASKSSIEPAVAD